VGSKPDELTALIKADYALWSNLVRSRGVKAE
jgi:hypothetical protein